MYVVAFNDSNNKIPCVFTETYRSAADAKKAIMADARGFARVHGGRPVAKCPKTLDYVEVKGEDGRSCSWGYYDIPGKA